MLDEPHRLSGPSRQPRYERVRLCVFSSGTDTYIPHAVVSLLSFKYHNPDYDMFVLCSEISPENQQLCAHVGVTAITLDLKREFHTEWQYPRECYFHFKAPEMFLAMGYESSVYIDGDTYCNGPLPSSLDAAFHVAGVSYDTVRELFLEIGELDQVVEGLGLRDIEGFERRRIQTGVLLYNNQALVDLDYFEKVVSLYEASIKAGVPRKGDDSLLALVTALEPRLTTATLPERCNLIDFKMDRSEGAIRTDDEIAECVIFHFVQQKPWLSEEWHPTYVHEYFNQKWLERMINNFPDSDIERCYPAHFKASVVPSKDVRFYWFTPQVNFGDWITPYLVEKVCGNSPSEPTDPLTTLERVVLSAGSIMRLCGLNTVVWGSGIRDRWQEISPGMLVRSVRGPLTRARILEVGGACPPIYGDPALLLPWFYDPGRVETSYQLGIAPHVSQYDRVRAVYGEERGVTVLDLRTKDVEAVVHKILQCEAIVSSSLHGIVVANAYDIPVRWVQFDTNIFGDNTKYYDHFASINRPRETFIDALGYKKLSTDRILQEIEPYVLDIDLDRLWDASIFHNGEVSKYIRYALS